jgi:SAM-dependent methyltransferase
MIAPPPVTEVLLKQALPDVRRLQRSAVISNEARGIALPNQAPKTRDGDGSEEPPVDAKFIAASFAVDAHPKIEDNYDYSVLEDFSKSGFCPSPTRMVNTGCGGGEVAVYFAKRGFSVVGIESDRTAVGLARERAWLAGADIDFMFTEQFETPNLLPAESFGLAVDRGAFYRFADDRDRQRYLGNIRRLLFKGGVLYLSAGFFAMPNDDRKNKRPPATKLLLVREGGVVVNEVRQAGFEVIHRVLRPTADSGDFGELLLTLRK